MITTEEALLRKLTSTKPQSKEPRQEFLGRLLEEVQKLGDDEWEKLGQEPGGTAAQQWCNNSVDARKADSPLPDFVPPDEDGEQDPGDEEEDEDVAKKVKAKAKAAKPSKKAKKAKAAGDDDKPSKSRATKARPGNMNGPVEGIKVRIKDLVIDEPNIGLEDLLVKLSKGGDKMSRMTVSSVRSETRHTLRVLKQKGKLKGVEI